ncbi:unnamed protein product [Symbiodinium natans]|uniref:Uncharacterized protein n=1 Tax=Symbiodinium natans TaxID=878477 RepID=A0A812IDD1_9DINO|nr:unnamed protein product [Symbiodinium natans]
MALASQLERQLAWNPLQDFPIWSTAPLALPVSKVEYKFIARRLHELFVKHDDKKTPVRWEGVEGNRQLLVEPGQLEVTAIWGDPHEKVMVNADPLTLPLDGSGGQSSPADKLP